jgi:hypothetical protein
MGEGSLIGFPARTTAVPVNNGRHCARPFWSTLPPGLAFPTHCPSLLPMHHRMSLLVSCAGDGGSLNVPVAVNCAWLVPAGGSIFTLCSCRPLPQFKLARERINRGPTESKRSPVTMHLRTKFDAGGMNLCARQVARGYVNSTSPSSAAGHSGPSTEKPLKRCFSQEASEKS